MAPDLNAVSAGGKWDYSAPGAKGYDIPDITMNDPGNRKIRVICMGAGVSGILTAYQISKYCQNVNLNIYEKNEDIGGTWLENRYPGCACDIPSHAYSYNFALNPDWPRYFSYSPDIWKYLNQICEVCDLRKYMTFNTEAIGCWWQEETGEWLVRFRQTAAGKEVREFEERCDLLVHACGLLNNYKWPDLPGMNKFKGNIYHTAKWPENYQAEQWKTDRVAVIGSGASSIQTVPNMQPHVKHMDVFVRTGVWFVEIANNFGSNKPYSDEEKDTFRHDPTQLTAHAKSIEDQVNGLWGAFYSDSPGQKMVSDLFYKRMAEHIKDERLLKGFTPKFGVGCRRVTPGDPYMKAIQEPNVDVHFTAVKEITENGVIGEDGQERETDTIICATGFDVSYKPRFPLVGKNGVDLKEKWKETPESYLGLAIPDFPNFLSYIGPTWPVENGSVMGPLLTVSEYMVQAIKKMQNENIKSFTPKQDVTDSFNEHAQEFITHTIWKDDCRAWYRNNETGRVNAVWPGSSLHYQHVIESPRWEDFEIERHDKKNMWAWLGLGWTQESVVNMQLVTAAAEHGDSVEGIDERTAKLAINRRPDSHGAAAGEVAGHPVEGGGSKAAVTEDSKPSNPLAPLPAKRVDVSPYLADRNLDFRWLAAHGMDREKAKQFVIDAAAKDAADKKRAEIERMEAGHGGDSASTMGFTNSFI